MGEEGILQAMTSRQMEPDDKTTSGRNVPGDDMANRCVRPTVTTAIDIITKTDFE
jgi:hypothetical protein